MVTTFCINLYISTLATLHFTCLQFLRFKNFAIFIGKHLQSCNFIKKRLQHRCFSVYIVKFLRTPALKNICERLSERFPTWTNNITSNIGSEEDIFSKTKQNKRDILKNIQLDEKNLPFRYALDYFVFLYFSNACQAALALYNKRWEWWSTLKQLKQ